MRAFCLVLFMQDLPPPVQRVMLGMNGSRVCFEREKMRLQLLEVVAVTRRAELRAMQLLELLDEFGMS